MPFLEKNLSDREGLMRVAAGFAGMIIGLFIMVVDPRGVIISIIGLAVVAEGYYRVSIIKSLAGGK